MKVLLALYLLGLVHGGFAGFREAAGRNLRIEKRRYFVRAVLRGIGFGQIAATIIFAVILILYLADGDAVLELLGRAGETALAIYVGYTLLVLLAFVPYAYPSVETRSLTIVAVFGPLTLMLPLVMLAGAVAAIVAEPRPEVAVLFAVSIASVSLVEPALAFFGFSKRDAARDRSDVSGGRTV